MARPSPEAIDRTMRALVRNLDAVVGGIVGKQRGQGETMEALRRMLERNAERLQPLMLRVAGREDVGPDDTEHPEYVTDDAVQAASELCAACMALASGATALLTFLDFPDEVLAALRTTQMDMH